MKRYFVPAALVLLLGFSSCNEEKKEGESVSVKKTEAPVIKNDIKPRKHEEAVSVHDFSSSQPFFSVLNTAPVTDWETITINERKKVFKYNNTQVISIDDEIVKSEILDDQILVNHGLSTGMSKAEVNSYFLDIEDVIDEDEVVLNITDNNILIRCCDQRENEWELIFENDTLVKITFLKTSSLE